MSVQVRPLADGDFFPWLGLYEVFGEANGHRVTDQVALRVWSWIIDPAHALTGVVAVDGSGELIGLAHHRTFVRPLTADHGVQIDDLYVADGAPSETADSLVKAVTSSASAAGAKVVRLSAAGGNGTALAIYDSIASRSDVVTYDIAL